MATVGKDRPLYRLGRYHGDGGRTMESLFPLGRYRCVVYVTIYVHTSAIHRTQVKRYTYNIHRTRERYISYMSIYRTLGDISYTYRYVSSLVGRYRLLTDRVRNRKRDSRSHRLSERVPRTKVVVQKYLSAWAGRPRWCSSGIAW